MTIDNTKVSPGTARCFAAIGGGYAIKMNIFRSEGEIVFGPWPTREEADAIVKALNKLRSGTHESASAGKVAA